MDKKVLTFPSEKVGLSPDNAEFDLVMARGDYLSKNKNQKYMVIGMLGTGTFGQVVRCVGPDGEEVAIKVVKNQPKYYNYEMNEVRILHKLLYNNLNDRFVAIKDVFMYKQHLCIVEELLGRNLYTFLKMTRFKGLDHSTVRTILQQVLEGMIQLSILGIIHCDLKPENILIADYDTFKVKIIDFGSAVTSPQGSHFYVQSRYYRAPEVILGIPYGSSCDVWSLGCIGYELYVGHPLFPGKDNTDQIGRIYGLFGSLPMFMIEHGKNSSVFFEKENGYRFVGQPSSFTLEDMKKAIRSKDNMQEDDDVFIEFLLRALEPSHLVRPDARSLSAHSYLKIKDRGGDLCRAPSSRNGVQQSTLPSSKSIRHMSTTGVILPSKKQKPSDDRRKISVYGISYENNLNRDTE
ncbi:protein kinase domain-containing protein [Encephalitozoon hellem ATCC 50504]|uniref:Dual specificity tyrosine-phosphorylation-regulated kinase 2 n=2 Tax=Encephalitozoon hellem TaxID=27973 RepID=A0A9Q9CE83_ENCHE|nr:protein kinase domain-containing protein [Encephalitozoon hellem ATCC 50504]AFM99282.1 protein kinase domain-containing protein [Encephalitozoon hellem ATCC 50504]UTX44284.1 dual specificity tyrosine-phosphorylation-regulated kinase 2 [Encephalitozoon hellem]WEL39782.1 protein kinase [Encephalitozoon hellem]|eukprot:XP_003888263.1 protein kinase domain-containing protein [Encephalitozoon hellem ATCC 50504]